jgi:hypothetical protein
MARLDARRAMVRAALPAEDSKSALGQVLRAGLADPR